jgi:CheY-like chemotaxis protein
MRCLLVEDNPADVALVRHALRAVVPPVELQVVEDGQAALDLLAQCAPYTPVPCPDVMLLDLNLPRKHGTEVLHALKQHPTLHVIPIVIFTSTAHPRDVHQCYALGANAFMVKPIELAEYLTAVQICVAFWRTCQVSQPRTSP